MEPQVDKSANYHRKTLSMSWKHESVRLCHVVVKQLVEEYMFATAVAIKESQLPTFRQIVGDQTSIHLEGLALLTPNSDKGVLRV